MNCIDRILFLMENQKITAHKLEVGCGLSNASIQAWKNGKANPSVEAIKKIAKYLNVSTDFLLFGESAKANQTAGRIIEGLDRPISDDELELFKLITSLTDAETAELSNFVDYIISKRKK